MKLYYHIQGSILAAVILLSSWAWGAYDADVSAWPQFRGPSGSGIAAPNANPPVEFGPTENVMWKAAVPSGHSSPCIWGDKLFLTGFDDRERKLKVLCLDRIHGTVLWSRDVPAEQIEQVHSISSPATATPATDGERIYVYFGSYGLLSYSLEGELMWSLSLPVPKVRFGSGTSPVVFADAVVLNRDEGGGAHALVVRCRDGKVKWEQKQAPTWQFGASSYSTPVLWRDRLIFHRAGEITAYSLEDGASLWSLKTATNGESTPVVGDDTLFVAAWTNLGEPELRVRVPDFGTLLKQYDTNKDGKIGRSEFPDDLVAARRPEVGNLDGSTVPIKPFWSMLDRDRNDLLDEGEWQQATVLVSSLSRDHGLMAVRPDGKGDITATHVLWQEKKDVSEVPSPLYLDGRVYMVASGGIVSCMEAKTGALVYRQRIPATGAYYASPVAARNRLYLASSKGVVTVMAAGPKPDVLSQTDLGEPILASPAIVEKSLYIRTAKHLYAFGH